LWDVVDVEWQVDLRAYCAIVRKKLVLTVRVVEGRRGGNRISPGRRGTAGVADGLASGRITGIHDHRNSALGGLDGGVNYRSALILVK
jgi:hypothetical protein